MALLDTLAQHSDEPGRLTRLYLSRAHRDAAHTTLRLMQEAGPDPLSLGVVRLRKRISVPFSLAGPAAIRQ